MWTDRFIKLPVTIYDRGMAKLTGNEDADSFESYLMVNPFEITSYRPHFNDNGELSGNTTVDFRSADNIIVLMPIEAFEKLLNEHHKAIFNH